MGRMWVALGLVGALLVGCGGGPADVGLDYHHSDFDGRGTDAAVVCGDGVVTGNELCDTAIAEGAVDACPTACTAPDACIVVDLVGAGCFTECVEQGITAFIDGDGCCPPGGNDRIDIDCATCGNSVVERGEDCDDGDTVPGDGCDADCRCEPGICGDGVINCGESCEDGGTIPGDGCDASCRIEAAAYMITDLYLRDPHIFAVIADVLCVDLTDMDDPLGQGGLGGADLGFVLVFRPLEQVDPTTVDVMTDAACTMPPGTVCTTGPDTTVTPRAATSEVPGGAECLAPLLGTLHPYVPPVVSTPPPCFVTDDGPLVLGGLGFDMAFSDAQVAALWWGDPATSLMTGLLRGFMPESVADATLLPDILDFVGGKPLSEILVGGTNNCECDHGVSPPGCDSDLDVGPDGVTPGWYFYFQFEAERVDWVEP